MNSNPSPGISPLRDAKPHGRTFTPAAARRLKIVVAVAACALGVLVGIGSAELSLSLFGEKRDTSSLVGLQEMQKLLDRSARETVESLRASPNTPP